MAQIGLWANVKDWIGGIGFAIYLWSQNLTADEYFELQARAAELQRAPVQSEQKCPSCLIGNLEDVMQCNYCFQVFDETDISKRSDGG